MRKSLTSRRFDVVVAGMAVADVLGNPVQFSNVPKPGGLKLIDSITLSTGGNVSNVGIDLAKLGFRVGGITRVGDDAFGRYILGEYKKHRIIARGIVIDSKAQTSATIVGIAGDGERTFLHTRGCLKNFRVSDMLKNLQMIKRAKIFVFGYLGLLPETEKDLEVLFRTIKNETDAKILLDTGGNPRKHAKRFASFIRHVDYFIPSYEEALALTGERKPERMIRFFRTAGAAGVVGIKLGAKGCLISGSDFTEYVHAYPVSQVVDTTGAGDAFIAGFIAGILKGFGPLAAAHIGNRVAAECVTAVGASTAIRKFSSYVNR